MNTSDLSRRLEPLKLADQGASIKRSIDFASMPRVLELLGDGERSVDVELHFSRDEQHRCIIQGRLSSGSEVVCERCLQPFEQPIQSDFALCVVASDEAARNIPHEYDPLILSDQFVDLVDIVEDEVLLALPMFSYHPEGECNPGPMSFGEDEQAEETAAESSEKKPNPFAVLSTLKLKK